MAKITEEHIRKTSTPGVFAPPILVYAATFGTAWLLQMRAPMDIAQVNLEMPGYIVVGIGAVINLWSLMTMRRAGVAISPYKPTESVVTTGPFRFTRNPIYLGMTLLYIGAALTLNMLWALVLLPVLLVIVLFGVILREERYLLLRFGTKYLRYKASVGRWL